MRRMMYAVPVLLIAGLLFVGCDDGVTNSDEVIDKYNTLVDKTEKVCTAKGASATAARADFDKALEDFKKTRSSYGGQIAVPDDQTLASMTAKICPSQ